MKIGSHSIESGLFRKLIGNFDPAKPLFEQYYNLFCSILFYKDKIIFGDMTLIDSNTPPSKKIISDIERILYNGRSRERFKGLKRLFNMPVKVDFPIGKLALSDSKSEPPTEVRAELIKAISDKNNRVRLNWLSAYKLLIIFYFLPHVFKALENKEEDQMLRGFRSLAYLNSLAKFEQLQNSLDFCKLVVDIDFLSRK